MTTLELDLDSHPHIRFRKTWKLTGEILYLLGQCESLVEAICEIPLHPNYHQHLLGVSLQKGARATTAIEGNTLTEEEIKKVAEGDPLPPSKQYQEIEVRNVLKAMNQVLKEIIVSPPGDGNIRPITPGLIRRLHKMIGEGLGEHFDAIPGRFREDVRVVGRYRSPPPELVEDLLDRLCRWLQREFRSGSSEQSFIEAVVEAIVAHVYIEWIHPFGDGNGRTGRLLEFYILLRAGNPDIASHILSNHYNDTRPEYYRQLDLAGKTGDLTEFISYAVTGLRDGLQQTLEVTQKNQWETAWHSYIYDTFAEHDYHKKSVFKRRRELILKMPTDKTLTADEMALATMDLAREYGRFDRRTLLRDIKILRDLKLVREVGKDKFVANTEQLRLQKARRLRP